IPCDRCRAVDGDVLARRGRQGERAGGDLAEIGVGDVERTRDGGADAHAFIGRGADGRRGGAAVETAGTEKRQERRRQGQRIAGRADGEAVVVEAGAGDHGGSAVGRGIPLQGDGAGRRERRAAGRVEYRGDAVLAKLKIASRGDGDVSGAGVDRIRDHEGGRRRGGEREIAAARVEARKRANVVPGLRQD